MTRFPEMRCRQKSGGELEKGLIDEKTIKIYNKFATTINVLDEVLKTRMHLKLA